jgi:DNA helicase II / ATP-dependent DNA helicase PcrA
MNNINEFQKKIITTFPDKRLIVKAGPGTGKTWSLIERIKYLVNNEDLEPATEILILSFSVAAVQEIKKRLAHAVEKEGYDDELLYVSIRTFDSFASYFMYSLDPDEDLDKLDYDQRIQKATEIILKNSSAKKRLQRLRHVMVDEVQDLVSVRADFTLAILEVAGSGFTLFGDPAQAVYNFLIGEDASGLTSDNFLEKVRFLSEIIPDEIVLYENFRVGENNSLKNLAEKGREYLINGNTEKAFDFLHRTFSDLESVGDLYNLKVPDNILSNSTAFLCRTNGQALLLAKIMKKTRIPFQVRKPLEEHDIPFWVGYVFNGWENQVIKKRDFIKAFESINSSGFDQKTAEEIWKDLQVLTSSHSGIRITSFRQALVERTIFSNSPEKFEKTGVVISTVHRAKGKEFDNVVLMFSEEISPEFFLDEARVMFVGLTRARKGLYRMSMKGGRGISKGKERWIRTVGDFLNKKLTGIEFGCLNDIDRHSPVSLDMFEEDEEYIEENQLFLKEKIKNGEDVRLKYFKKTDGIPLYLVQIRSDRDWIPVAHSSVSFGRSLKNCLKELRGKKPYLWPKLIDDLWVREVVTEIGNLGNEDIPRFYRTTGLWLGVRVEGLGTCHEWGKI